MAYDPLTRVIDETLTIDASVIEQLRAYRRAPKLTDLPGVDVAEERARLESILNGLADRLVDGVLQHPSKRWVLAQFQPALASVVREDTEAREHFGTEVESIMDMVGIDSSDGLLDFYLVGF